MRLNKTMDGSANAMTDKRHWILVTASILTFGLWVGCAAAEEPDSGSSAADLINVTDNNVLGDNEMLAVASGNGNSLGAVSDPDGNVSHNKIGDNSTTGDVSLSSANTGGINVNFANSGNNVVMQNSMAINVYLTSPVH
jgi:hypothetical protein